VNPSPGEVLAIAGLVDWLPYGKALNVVALGALLAMFLVLVVVGLMERRRMRQGVDQEWLGPKHARRTDYLWEDRYGKDTDY
jgi:hypothetical protein